MIFLYTQSYFNLAPDGLAKCCFHPEGQRLFLSPGWSQPPAGQSSTGAAHSLLLHLLHPPLLHLVNIISESSSESNLCSLCWTVASLLWDSWACLKWSSALWHLCHAASWVLPQTAWQRGHSFFLYPPYLLPSIRFLSGAEIDCDLSPDQPFAPHNPKTPPAQYHVTWKTHMQVRVNICV